MGYSFRDTYDETKKSLRLEFVPLKRTRKTTHTLCDSKLDAFVAGATQRLDCLEHRALVRGRWLDVVVCTEMDKAPLT